MARRDKGMPIVCPHCGRILARRCAGFILIAYGGRAYRVLRLQEVTCRCRARVDLSAVCPLDNTPSP